MTANADGSARAKRHRVLGTLSRWGFPLVSVATTLASQISLPSILQRRLSIGEYTAYVAVTSLAAYLGLADGGTLMSVLREMSALHGAGDRARFAGEVRRARRVFAGIALVGCAVAAIGLTSTLRAATAAWAGAATTSFRASVLEVLATTAVGMGIGSFQMALQLSTGRLLAGQVASLVSSLAPLLALLVGLFVARDLAIGFHVFAGAQLLVAVWRAWDAHRVARQECGDATPSRPPLPLHHLLTAGFTYKVAEVLPASAFPNLLAVQAPAFVPTGVPARTFANASRIVPNQFLGLLQVHATRRLAGSASERNQGEREYAESASLLCAMHLCALAVVATLAVPVFRLWLPASAARVVTYLPGLLVEQALLAAALPSTILLMARGRLRAIGSIKLVGAVMGLGVFVATLSFAREAAYGIGFAVAAAPLYLFAAWVELRPPPDFPKPDIRTYARYGLALTASVACSLYAKRPGISSVAITLCAFGLVPASARSGWRLLRDLRGAPQHDADRHA